MKRRILIAFVVLVGLFVVYRTGKGPALDWYFDHYVERPTSYPSSELPDEICLTWSGDPRTTQAIQWRTSPAVQEGAVEYREKSQGEDANQTAKAIRTAVEDRMVKNDPVNHRFTAALSGLKPATSYLYRVGSPEKQRWSDWATFSTAPADTVPYSFVYMGDVQIGFEYWENILQESYRFCPDAAFFVVAGDLVDNGDRRDQWDSFFHAAQGVFNCRPLIPTLGNHDYAKEKDPQMYLDLLALPEKGAPQPGPERSYAFRYSNTLFVVLDSNRAIEEQAPWLEEQLKNSDATWKIAIYHHPAYVSKEHRDNEELFNAWTPLFDKYDLDIALQGHDHAYLRTYPMRAGKRAPSTKDGVIYAVAVAGNKYYEQLPHDYAEKAFPNVSTYQVIDVTLAPDRLRYRAFDDKNQLRDEVVLEK